MLFLIYLYFLVIYLYQNESEMNNAMYYIYYYTFNTLKSKGLNKEGDIAVWSAETGTQISLWKGHTQQVTALKWSPKTELAITCGSTVAFWLPGTAAV